MKIPRLRAHRGAPGAAADGLTAERQTSAPDEARILRRTRTRLMAVSGGVTLAILIVLGAAIYGIVATAIEVGGQSRLKTVAGLQTDANQEPGLPVQGEAAGVIVIRIDSSGTPLPPRPDVAIPAGLPNAASLAAARQSGQPDLRNVTAADGTPYRVISGYATRPQGWMIQLAVNRSAEVNLLNTLLLVLLGGGLAALLASLAAGYVYAGRALVPIRAALDRQRDALTRQREFAANASHELRTPLTVIRASVEDLRRNRRSRVEDVGEALEDIDAETRHLTALVEDLLLLARTDSGVVQVEQIPLDLADVAAEAASVLAPLAAERSVQLLLDPLPAPSIGDPLRLRQLVTILVDNAIGHSPPASTVSLHVRTDGPSALLWVEDEGPGIRPEDLPRLFERFYRADDAPAGGTGLGLAIARWIVERHHGLIGAGNRAEGGARFWVRLPSPEAAAALGGGVDHSAVPTPMTAPSWLGDQADGRDPAVGDDSTGFAGGDGWGRPDGGAAADGSLRDVWAGDADAVPLAPLQRPGAEERPRAGFGRR